MPTTEMAGPRAGLAETDDQRALADAVASSLDRGWSEQDLSAFLSSGEPADPESVSRALSPLGLAGAVSAEQAGGLGLGWTDLTSGLEVLGRRLAPTFFLEQLTASELLRGAPPGAPAGELLAGHLEGTRRLTAVLVAPASEWGVQADLRVTRAEGAIVLDGSVEHVGGPAGTTYLLAVTGPDGPVLVVVDEVDAGVERTPLDALDLLRPVSRLAFTRARATVVDVDDVPAAIARATAAAIFVLACEQVGAADRCLAGAVAHSRQREQFGQPIGSFQAVRHRCAEMLVQVELARSAVRHLGADLDLDGPAAAMPAHHEALAVAASLAHIRASRALEEASRGYIQILGAMGYTWEVDAHLSFRKAASTAVMLGTGTEHRRALGRHLGLIGSDHSTGARR